jgi:hypothetical protein
MRWARRNAAGTPMCSWMRRERCARGIARCVGQRAGGELGALEAEDH